MLQPHNTSLQLSYTPLNLAYMEYMSHKLSTSSSFEQPNLDHLRFSYEGENFLHVFGLKGSVLGAFEAEIQRQVFELQNHEMLDFIQYALIAN